jgi:hypothetical protein
MRIEDELLTAVRGLPLERQREVLDFAEFLARKTRGAGARESVRGLCADLQVRLSREEIDEARRELWASFPREDV